MPASDSKLILSRSNSLTSLLDEKKREEVRISDNLELSELKTLISGLVQISEGGRLL